MPKAPQRRGDPNEKLLELEKSFHAALEDFDAADRMDDAAPGNQDARADKRSAARKADAALAGIVGTRATNIAGCLVKARIIKHNLTSSRLTPVTGTIAEGLVRDLEQLESST